MTMKKTTQQAIKTPRRSSWKTAKGHGVDMSLIESNLMKSPMERMIRHEQARHVYLTLRDAGRSLNDR